MQGSHPVGLFPALNPIASVRRPRIPSTPGPVRGATMGSAAWRYVLVEQRACRVFQFLPRVLEINKLPNNQELAIKQARASCAHCKGMVTKLW